jgi:hypothetical protein
MFCGIFVFLCVSDAIISWVKKNIGPSVIDITSTDEAKKILESETTFVAAVFDKLEVFIYLYCMALL